MKSDITRERVKLEWQVPEISRFYGIVIYMYYNDHAPPHLHAKYGSDEAVIRVDRPELMAGSLPARALGMVLEWTALHRDELLDDWLRFRTRQPFRRIDPLP